MSVISHRIACSESVSGDQLGDIADRRRFGLDLTLLGTQRRPVGLEVGKSGARTLALARKRPQALRCSAIADDRQPSPG
jgi:hypothetical protein